VSERLSADGYGVILWGRTGADLDAVACNGPDVRTAEVDVADPASVESAVGKSMGDIESLRAVVINAGSGTWTSFPEVGVSEWRQTLGANLDGAFFTLRSTISRLAALPGGQVVGICSDSGLYPFPSRAAYCASKAGMKSLLDSMRLDTRALGVRTTVLMPGRVDTSFGGKQPGDRPDALQAIDIADTVSGVLALPGHVEMREVHIASVSSGFGPFREGVH
jgi:NADP-dependent 3-hydroxy acid dehydrogenase YdfG